ncbi:MAG: radical SAM protein [Nanoarchaeota archaeon]
MERKLVEVAYEITHICNLRCTHCYNKSSLGSRYEMTTEDAIRAIEKLGAFGVKKVKIGGGEPMARKDLFEIYTRCTSLGFETQFSTNGILVMQNLEKMAESGVSKIQVSLDNVGEKHDAIRNYHGMFGIVENAVRELNRNNIRINIATTLTTANHNDLKAILDFCAGNDIERWKIMKYIPKSSKDPLLLPKEEYRKAVLELLGYKEQSKEPEIIIAREFDLIHEPSDYNDMQCFGGKSFFSLKPNGDVTPCSYITDIVCGNITRDSLESIWNSEKMIAFSRDYYDTNCSICGKCKGGCKAISYFMEKEIKCDPYCWVKGR